MSFDPIASAVAIIALGISIWAVVVTKREPHRARTRAARDSLRDSLIDLRNILGSAMDALDRGRDVGPVPDRLAAAEDAMRLIGPRLQEHAELDAIWQWVQMMKSRWREASHHEEAVSGLMLKRALLTADAEPIAISRYNSQIEDSTRRREAARSGLKEEVVTVQTMVTAYLRRLDAADRSQREVS